MVCESIDSGLEAIGRKFESFESVLDFGCGSGRAVRWFASRSPLPKLYGTDIDTEAVTWCQDNLPFAVFDTNDPLPPLRYADRSFDLIYAASVFTHINVESQFLWLRELQRVAKPGAIIILSFLGPHTFSFLPPEVVEEIKEKGIVFREDNFWEGSFPDWYQTTFQLPEYTEREYAKYFEVLRYFPRGMTGFQDMFLFRKRA